MAGPKELLESGTEDLLQTADMGLDWVVATLFSLGRVIQYGICLLYTSRCV